MQKKFSTKTYLDKQMYDALKAKGELFKAHNYELASLLVLQHDLIANGVVDVISDNDKENLNLAKIEVLTMCQDIAGEENILEAFNELVSNKEQSKDSSVITEAEIICSIVRCVEDLASRFQKNNIRGETEAKAKIKDISDNANSLTNGMRSNSDVQQIYDTDHSLKSLRVFDKLLTQLTALMNVKDRGMLAGEDTLSQLTHVDGQEDSKLLKNIQKGLNNALILHSRFLKDPGVDGIKLMKSLLTTLNRDDKKLSEDFLKVPGKQIDKDELAKNDVDARLTGLRSSFAKFYNTLGKFASENGECVRLHLKKKEINSNYKKKLEAYNSIETAYIWNRGKRLDNIKLVLKLNEYKQKVDELEDEINTFMSLDEAEQKKQLVDLNNLQKRKDYYSNLVTETFEQVKDLNLKNFVNKVKPNNDDKKELSVQEFLDKAMPTVDAFVYFKGLGDGKKTQSEIDRKEIASLKEERNKLRKSLNEQLALGKKAFGTETIQQLQRAIMIAVYISSKDNPSGNAMANTPESRERIESILKNNMGYLQLI